jgi:hypothetical protein
MTARQERNCRDFFSLVEEVNQVMADSLSFAYLPGDNADLGKAEEYELVREGLDRLQLPWVAIVGDHDIHSKRHYTFLRFMMPEPFYRLEVGSYRFLALDAFVSDDPKVFDISSDQLDWLPQELDLARAIEKRSILFLHCYPSELGTSSSPLRDLIKRFGVLLVDMGHTHYNEIANDGLTLYTATRSTGQIEEGPVGFSVTNLDNGVLLRGFAAIGDQKVDLEQFAGSALWHANLDINQLSGGVYSLTVNLIDETASGAKISSEWQ